MREFIAPLIAIALLFSAINLRNTRIKYQKLLNECSKERLNDTRQGIDALQKA